MPDPRSARASSRSLWPSSDASRPYARAVSNTVIPASTAAAIVWQAELLVALVGRGEPHAAEADAELRVVEPGRRGQAREATCAVGSRASTVLIPYGGMKSDNLNRVAFSATAHCLTGCAIGEVLGVVIGTALGWSDAPTIALAVVLAFFFGYLLTMVPLLRAGLALASAIPLALASDTFSIAVMELVDNGVLLLVPGAMDAGLAEPLFWGSLAFALAVAFVAAFPVNRWLIARGKGHAVVHAHHGHDAHG